MKYLGGLTLKRSPRQPSKSGRVIIVSSTFSDCTVTCSSQFVEVLGNATPAHIAKLCWACAVSGYEDQQLQDVLAEHMLRTQYRCV